MKARYPLPILLALLVICNLRLTQAQNGTQPQNQEGGVRQETGSPAITWGDAVNGLQMSISQDQTFRGTNRGMQLTVTFHNVGQGDETFMTGGAVCGVQRDVSAEVELNLTDLQGTQHRHLPFWGDGPPYGGGVCGGVIGNPNVVTLHAGASVSMALSLGKYLDLSDSKAYEMHRFPAGTYSLRAELTNRTNFRINSASWNGTMLSNVLQVHFDAEFGSVFGDCDADGHCAF